MSQPASKILIIDDDPHIAAVLTVTLEEANFKVAAVSSGRDGLRAAYEYRPDLILLDISMPGTNGFEVLDTLRLVTDVPVIMLTAMTHDPNRIRSLDKGAADFIAKGTHVDVLLAHIYARLRAYRAHRIPEGPRRFDDSLEVDLERRRLRIQNQIVDLTPLQWKLFQYLVENEGRVVSYRNLLKACWENSEFGDSGGVKVQISLLREKLRDSARSSRYIHTIRTEGYMFEVRSDEMPPTLV